MKCPGQDSRYWDSGAIFETQCPNCGHTVEFFKDESSRKCKKCGHKFVNPKMDFGCASYCKFAAQCLGDLPPELMAKRDDLLRDRVALEMKKYFGRDFKRIAHAMKVSRYAEQIVKQEHGDPAIVLAAAYLHDIGIKEAERLHQSSAADHREELGPPVAREILSRLGAREELIEEVCHIIGHHHHHHPGDSETVNFKCLYDANLIVSLEETLEENPQARETIGGMIDKDLLTETGKVLARQALLGVSG